MKRLLADKPVYLDTNVFIYALEGHQHFADRARELLKIVCANPGNCLTSELTLTEVLVLPLRRKNAELVRHYREFLTDPSKVSLIPISREILLTAADLRAHNGHKLPDAIHIASAVASKCTFLITEDRAIKPSSGLEILALSGLAS